jgi:drug/metabolite transporter (DMT)-like permease
VDLAIPFALLSSLCFGIAHVTARVGLRTLDARAGAAISVPSAALLFIVAAPVGLDLSQFSATAALLFAVVGLFFPAVVTLLNFRSNELLGATATSTVSGTTPLFALVAAALLLDEKIPARAAVAAAGVVLGIGLLSWNPGAVRGRFAGWPLLVPLAGAVVRALAQVGARAALLLWPNPFAASLIGYAVSSAAVISADRLAGTERRKLTAHGVTWFAITGALNGGAVLLMYLALTAAPVALVAPIVAAYPLVTALVSAVALREETVNSRMLIGAAVTVAAIVYLVAAPAALGADKPDAQQAQAKITRAEAEKTALALVPGGSTLSGNLERAKGRLVWSFDIRMPRTKNITEVHVDAQTGAVVSKSIETPAEQAKEAAAEKKKQ